MFKLTQEDKEYLKKIGESEKDFAQIEESGTTVILTLNDKRISLNKAIEVLGRETFLSGLDRCAFHFTASPVNEAGEVVFFNNKRLWDKYFK